MIRAISARWRAAILVCGKCEKKLDRKGFGPHADERLSKLLRRRGSEGKGRKATLGVIAVPCLKICPKRAVMVLNGACAGRWLAIPAGTPVAEVEALLEIASHPTAGAAA